MHSIYDVTVKVKDFESKKPVSNIKVSISYDYDSYGMFYFANTPQNVSATTNSNGEAELKLADYRYRILMRVSSSPADLNKELIRIGGSLVVPINTPSYIVELSPK